MKKEKGILKDVTDKDLKLLEKKPKKFWRSVKTIGYKAFKGLGDLTSIEIPKGVTRIEEKAFDGCSALTSITLPEGLTTINGSAFKDCSGLTSITLPDSVTYLGESAFQGCSGLTSINIPDGVEVLWVWTFSGCASLKSITIPSSMKTVGFLAFQGCSGLSSVTLSKGVTYIDDSSFTGCKSLKSIVIPEGVNSIKDTAFQGCSSLESVTIAQSVKFIGEKVFNHCPMLKNVTLEYKGYKFDVSVQQFEEGMDKEKLDKLRERLFEKVRLEEKQREKTLAKRDDYEGVKQGRDETLAKLCSFYRYDQNEYNKIKGWLEDGDKIVAEGREKLFCKIDNAPRADEITYELFARGSASAAFVGTATGGTQTIRGAEARNLKHGLTNPNGGIIAFKKNGRPIGQSWVWFDEKQKIVCFDDIQITNSEKLAINSDAKAFAECIARAAEGFKEAMKEHGTEVSVSVNKVCDEIKANFNCLDCALAQASIQTSNQASSKNTSVSTEKPL